MKMLLKNLIIDAVLKEYNEKIKKLDEMLQNDK